MLSRWNCFNFKTYLFIIIYFLIILPLYQYTHTQYSTAPLIQSLKYSQNLVMVLPRKAWESKTHLIIQQIFMQQIFVSYWRLKDEKNRVLAFIKISVWIMVIILSPTLFLHSEALVSHTPWKMPTSHSVPFFEDRLALPLVYHPSSFFKENSWVCFFLSWEGRHMCQTVSICIVIFLISRLSLNQPPLPDNLPQRQSKVAGHLVKKKKKKVGKHTGPFIWQV